MLNAGPWIVFELAINIFQSFLYMYYPWKVLGQKNHFKSKMFFMLAVALQFIQLTVFNIFTLFEGFGILVSFFCILINTLIFLEGTITKKLIVSTIPIILSALISITTILTASNIFQSTSYELLNYNYPTRFYIVIIVNIIYSISILLSVKLSRHLVNIFNQKEWKHFSVVTIFCIISLTSLFLLLLETEKTLLSIYIYISMLSTTSILVFIFFIIRNINQKHRIETENDLLKQQFILQQKNIENIKDQYEKIKKVRHDFNNTLCVIKTLNSTDSRDQIDEYISSYIKSTAHLSSVITTKNEYINAIINAKFSEAAELGIQTVISISSDFDPPITIDICNLLGNMFDNAIRASKSTEAPSLIRLDISSHDSETVISMKNSISQSAFETNPELLTDKTDSEYHGFGTKIIRDIAKRNHGFADFYEEDNMFCCNVTLYI